MDANMFPLTQKLIHMQPDRKEYWQHEHKQAVHDQCLFALIGVLVGNIKDPTRVQAQVVEPVKPGDSPTTTNESAGRVRLQMEKVKTPKFEGDNTEWLLFQDRFDDIVGTAAGYDAAVRGHILRECVPKEARERIKHLKLASEMFTELDRMYGDKDVSLSIIVKKLSTLSLTKKTEFDNIVSIMSDTMVPSLPI